MQPVRTEQLGPEPQVPAEPCPVLSGALPGVRARPQWRAEGGWEHRRTARVPALGNAGGGFLFCPPVRNLGPARTVWTGCFPVSVDPHSISLHKQRLCRQLHGFGAAGTSSVGKLMGNNDCSSGTGSKYCEDVSALIPGFLPQLSRVSVMHALFHVA